MSEENVQAARKLLADVLSAVERQELEADGPLGRSLQAHLRGAQAAFDALISEEPPTQ